MIPTTAHQCDLWEGGSFYILLADGSKKLMNGMLTGMGQIFGMHLGDTGVMITYTPNGMALNPRPGFSTLAQACLFTRLLLGVRDWSQPIAAMLPFAEREAIVALYTEVMEGRATL